MSNLCKRVSDFGLTFGLVVIMLSTTAWGQANPLKITILHTNDIHGSYLPGIAAWETDKPSIGGFDALNYYVKQERAKSARSLLLDAGDLMTGTLICDMEYRGAYGGALIEMMNMIGYEGWEFGNHDFDKSASNLRKLIGLAQFPVFCANFTNDGRYFTHDPCHIYNCDSLRVGVIGITYHLMAGMAPPEKLEGFISTDPIAAVNEAVAEIDSLTDLIIVLSHLGIENDRELAKNTRGVDLIIGGHSHTRLEQPEVVNGVLIAQTGSNCRNLGELDLVVAGDSIMTYSGRLIPLYTKNIVSDSALAALIDSFKADIDKSYGVVIAELKQPWETQYRAESNIGDWLTDAMRLELKTDVAFLNSGGIRKNLPAGPVTKMDIHEILPFDNKLVTFQLTGAQLIQIALHNIGLEQDSYQGSLQVAGLTYAWKVGDSGPELVEVMVNGALLKPEKTYSVATIDYVALSNGEKYFGFIPQAVSNADRALTELILESVEKAKIIDSRIEGRARKLP